MDTASYKEWLEQAPLEFQKKLVQDFTNFTIEYAQTHVEKGQKELAELSADQLQERLTRLQKWISYIEFQEHTLGEFKGTRLDNAFRSFLEK